MLTLTRKIGEEVVIGDNIRVVVKEIRKNQVRLGFVVNDGTPIFRKEIAMRMTDKEKSAKK